MVKITDSNFKAINAFNDYGGIEIVKEKAFLLNLELLPVDVEGSNYWENGLAKIVFTLKEWNVENTLRVAELARYLRADEFHWQVVNGQYVVRLWWD